MLNSEKKNKSEFLQIFFDVNKNNKESAAPPSPSLFNNYNFLKVYLPL